MELGVALGIVSLSFQTFAGCVTAFDLLCKAQNLGRDATLEHTKLLLQEYRFIEWARVAQLDTADEERMPKSINANLAALLLGQLEATLSSVEHLKKRYKLEVVAQKDDGVNMRQLHLQEDETNADDVSSMLSTIMSPQAREDISVWRSKVKRANAFPKRLRWAAVDKKGLSLLVSDVTVIIDGLWMLLDTASKVRASHKLNSELVSAVQDCQDIGALQQLQSALQDGGENGITLSDTVSASASIKAALMSEPSSAPTTIKAPKPLDSEPLKIDGKLDGTPLGTGSFADQHVLVEDKHVPHNLKNKLRVRVTDLVSLLSRDPSPALLTLRCLGYTEEPFGFRLLFSIPASQPVSLLNLLCDSHTSLPPVGDRLELALNIVKTVLAFHAAGWLHKDIRSENILLFPRSLPASGISDAPKVHHLHGLDPRLCNFSFARRDNPTEISDLLSTSPDKDIYRHPDALGEVSSSFARHMDAYALGCVLVEIAEWSPLRRIIRKKIDITDTKGVKEADFETLPQWLRQRYVGDGSAAFRLGQAFQDMVALCFPPKGLEENIEIERFLEILENLERCKI